MPTIKIEKTLELSNTDIDDLMTTALEGGINYWCRKVKVVECPTDDYGYASDVIALGGTLALYDAESNEKWELNLDKFLTGVKKYCEENGYTDGGDLMQEHDADTADQIVQYALFDEIVYG